MAFGAFFWLHVAGGHGQNHEPASDYIEYEVRAGWKSTKAGPRFLLNT